RGRSSGSGTWAPTTSPTSTRCSARSRSAWRRSPPRRRTPARPGRCRPRAWPGKRPEPAVRVLVTEPLDPAALSRLAAAGHEVIERHGLQGGELAAALDGCQALIVRGATKVTGDVIRSAGALKVVARAGTGVDNIDVA